MNSHKNHDQKTLRVIEAKFLRLFCPNTPEEQLFNYISYTYDVFLYFKISATFRLYYVSRLWFFIR